MTEPTTSKHLIYCDECHHLVKPGEPYYRVAGLLICQVCWSAPPHRK